MAKTNRLKPGTIAVINAVSDKKTRRSSRRGGRRGRFGRRGRGGGFSATRTMDNVARGTAVAQGGTILLGETISNTAEAAKAGGASEAVKTAAANIKAIPAEDYWKAYWPTINVEAAVATRKGVSRVIRGVSRIFGGR